MGHSSTASQLAILAATIASAIACQSPAGVYVAPAAEQRKDAAVEGVTSQSVESSGSPSASAPNQQSSAPEISASLLNTAQREPLDAATDAAAASELDDAAPAPDAALLTDASAFTSSTAATPTTSSTFSATCTVVAPTDCPEPAPRWQDIQPIINERCVSCHYGALDGPWPLTDYGHVADWQNEIRGAMLHCSMPPPGETAEMNSEERLQLLTWIRCGLPR